MPENMLYIPDSGMRGLFTQAESAHYYTSPWKSRSSGELQPYRAELTRWGFGVSWFSQSLQWW